MKQSRKFQKKGTQSPTSRIEKKNTLVSISKKQLYLWLAIISISTIIVYAPAFKNEITNWDDDNYIVKNPWLQELSGENIKSIFTEYYMGNYHPLAMLSLSLDFQIGGLDKEGEIVPWIYHFTNIFLHLVNTLLVFWLAWLLLGRIEIAVLTGLLFGLGTLHVESVAWISERKDVLYALFFIASLIAYVYYLKKKEAIFYVYSLVLFILSLLSKGQAVSLAVTLFIVDYLYERKLLDKKVILEKLPFLVLSVIFGIIAIKAQQAGNALHDSDSYAFYKRIGFAGYAFTQYLIKLTVPVSLSAIYPYPDIINKSIPGYYWLFMLPALAVAYAFFYYLKRNRIVAFCIGFFIINIFLLLQLIPVGSAILADRYSYIPSIGFHLLMAWMIFKLVEKNTAKKTLIYGISGAYLLVIGAASFNRTQIWNDSLTLWDDTIEKSPAAVVAWNNRGSIKDREKKHNEAIEDFTRAIVLKPDYTHAFYNRGTSKKDWASERKDSAMLQSAIRDFDQAIEFDKNFVEAYHNRGLAKENLSEYAKTLAEKNKLLSDALADYDRTVELNPLYENALVNRGVIKGKMGNLDDAIIDFNKAIEMTPENASAYSNRGLAKDNKGDMQGAIADYNIAIEKDPEFVTAYLNRGIVYRRMKNYDASIKDFTKAILLDKELAAAYYFRGLDQIALKNGQAGCNDLQMAVNYGHPYAIAEYQHYCVKSTNNK
ncbi:MAG: tetratricopeptide repeat protein [Bacteroidales bacterium]|nr:tetratricopeptide repeat protein [Bacteroidales bacterium]